MPTAPPVSHDASLETQVFWLKYKKEIVAVLVIALLAAIGFGSYRIYTAQRDSSAATLLGSASTEQDYQMVIDKYPGTSAAASASLLLADSQRKEKKFTEANTTLQNFIDRNPDHEFVPTAKMAIAANLESMGKMDDALAAYQQVASRYPRSFNAPVALISQVSLLKTKGRNDEARQICEGIMTNYRDSLLASEAARQLRLLKPLTQTERGPGQSAPGAGASSTPPPLLTAPSNQIAIPAPNPAAPPQPNPTIGKPR